MSVPYIIHIQSCFFIGFKKTPILNFQVKTHRAVHFNGRDWARTLTLFVKQKPSKISQQARASLQLEPPHPTTIRYIPVPPHAAISFFVGLFHCIIIHQAGRQQLPSYLTTNNINRLIRFSSVVSLNFLLEILFYLLPSFLHFSNTSIQNEVCVDICNGLCYDRLQCSLYSILTCFPGSYYYCYCYCYCYYYCHHYY